MPVHGTGKKANELSHKILLDPVGAGASKLRTDTAVKLAKEIKFDVIRGNISEIKTLALGSGTTKGVDADVSDAVTEENLDNAVAFVKDYAKKSGCVIAITGAIDLVSDGEKCYVIRNGRPEMSKITGTGCQLSGMTTAFIVANPDNVLEATAAAVCTMGLAGAIVKTLSFLSLISRKRQFHVCSAVFSSYLISALTLELPDRAGESSARRSFQYSLL